MNIGIEQEVSTETTIIHAPAHPLAQKRWHAAVMGLASSRLLAWAALVFVFSALPLVHISEATIGDPDIWWHMRAGEWIAQHHQVPHLDPFSATTMGQSW